MRRRHAAVIVLILLAIADVVLVFATVRSTRVRASQIAPIATNPAAAQGDSTAASGTGGSSAKPAGKIVLAALTRNRAWRAQTPSARCKDGGERATIGHSEDGGRTWTTVDVPMITVSGLSLDNQKMLATGLDTACRPVTYALSSTGRPSRVSTAAAWSVDPSTPTGLLVSGAPAAKNPCKDAIVDIAADSASELVALCADGSIESTSDTAASWHQLSGPSGTVTIATGSGNAVYTAARADCGIAVRALPGTRSGSGSASTGSLSTGPGPCLPGTDQWNGPIDMTIVGGTVWLGTSDATITEPVANVG